MAINDRLLPAIALCAAALLGPLSAGAREAASPSACQAAAAQPPIAAAKSALDANPNDLQTRFNLADAWSDAGCFSDAVQVLQAATVAHAGNKELETRLRVAHSLVGEERFFDNIDRADAAARLKRASFRCTNLYDLDACTEALRLKPDDPALLVAQGDSLVRARRPADAISRYRLASVIAPNQHDVAARITAAESQLPPAAAGATITPAKNAPGVPAPRTAALQTAAIPAVAALASHRYSNAALGAQSH